MEITYLHLVIILLILAAVVLIAAMVVWLPQKSPPASDSNLQFESDYKLLTSSLTADAHLQRLLMVEIIADKTSEVSSETVTFSKMTNSMTNFGKALVRSFGISTAQKIAMFMHKRNEVLRDYYREMRNVVCTKNQCAHIIEIIKGEKPEPTKVETPFPSVFPSGDMPDVTYTAQRKLDALAREITDTISSIFHVRDAAASGTRKTRSLTHNERIFNLLTMYDKELVNQAKFYASQQYDVSMNCAQGSIEISQHISEEFGALMKHNQLKLQMLTQ